MGVYENFETIKDALGYANLSTEEIIAKGHLSEASIAMIDKKMEEDLVAENQRLRMEIEYLKKLSALVLAEEQKNGKKQK